MADPNEDDKKVHVNFYARKKLVDKYDIAIKELHYDKRSEALKTHMRRLVKDREVKK